jgi:protein-tyrosine-phosphatase
MAEAIARAEIRRGGIVGVKVWSRGLAGGGGMETADYAVSALRKLGLRLARRPSLSLTLEDLEAADLVLTMTSGQKERLAADWPVSLNKAFVISEFSGTGRGDVRDPMGCPEEEYDECASRLKDEITKMVPKLRRTLSRRRPKR